MPPRKRLTREESKAQTREEVLRAAGRLFLRDGFVATSLSAIAEEAGVTKGAVYSNFESKEDLFLTIVRGEAQQRAAARDALSLNDWSALDDDEPLSARLAAMGRAAHARSPEIRQVSLFLEYNAFALRNRRSREYVREHNADYFEETAEAIGARVSGDRPDRIAAVAQSLYVGLLLHRAFEPERFDEDLFAEAFAALAALASSPVAAD